MKNKSYRELIVYTTFGYICDVLLREKWYIRDSKKKKAGVVYILIYVSGCDRTSVRGTQRLFSVISVGRSKHCLDFSITLACVEGAWK